MNVTKIPLHVCPQTSDSIPAGYLLYTPIVIVVHIDTHALINLCNCVFSLEAVGVILSLTSQPSGWNCNGLLVKKAILISNDIVLSGVFA